MAIRDYVGYENGDQLDLKPTLPTSGGKVGDPGMFGRRGVMLLTDQDPVTGKATLKFNGAPRFTVHAVNGSGSVAIAPGDDIYYDPSPGNGNPFLNKDATNGQLYGQALEAIASGAKADIYVRPL